MPNTGISGLIMGGKPVKSPPDYSGSRVELALRTRVFRLLILALVTFQRQSLVAAELFLLYSIHLVELLDEIVIIFSREFVLRLGTTTFDASIQAVAD
jgi:hypothetical protein